MSQVPVQWANTCELWTDTPNGPVYESSEAENHMIPVVPLSALREVVGGLKRNAENEPEQNGYLSAIIDLQRLLASLGEQ